MIERCWGWLYEVMNEDECYNYKYCACLSVYVMLASDANDSQNDMFEMPPDIMPLTCPEFNSTRRLIPTSTSSIFAGLLTTCILAFVPLPPPY